MSFESSVSRGIHAGLMTDSGNDTHSVLLPTDKELVLKGNSA